MYPVFKFEWAVHQKIAGVSGVAISFGSHHVLLNREVGGKRTQFEKIGGWPFQRDNQRVIIQSMDSEVCNRALALVDGFAVFDRI